MRIQSVSNTKSSSDADLQFAAGFGVEQIQPQNSSAPENASTAIRRYSPRRKKISRRGFRPLGWKIEIESTDSTWQCEYRYLRRQMSSETTIVFLWYCCDMSFFCPFRISRETTMATVVRRNASVNSRWNRDYISVAFCFLSCTLNTSPNDVQKKAAP